MTRSCTATCVAVAVAGLLPGSALAGTGTTLRSVSVRATPAGAVIGKLPARRAVTITCQRNGPLVRARSGSTRIWDRIRFGKGTGFVSDSQISTAPPAAGGLVASICDAPSLTAVTPGATQGPCSVTSPAPLARPYKSNGAFIRASVSGAQTSQRETRVPSSVTIAQAILESGFGRSTAGANNYFGIKAVLATPGVYRWSTIAIGCVLRKTQEFRNRAMATEIGAFRAYTGLKDSIRDHGALLVANPVYASAFAHTDSPKTFARIIARRYATDPAYATSITKLMDRYKLTRYDVKVAAAPKQPPAGSTPVTPPAPGGGVPAP